MADEYKTVIEGVQTYLLATPASALPSNIVIRKKQWAFTLGQDTLPLLLVCYGDVKESALQVFSKSFRFCDLEIECVLVTDGQDLVQTVIDPHRTWAQVLKTRLDVGNLPGVSIVVKACIHDHSVFDYKLPPSLDHTIVPMRYTFREAR